MDSVIKILNKPPKIANSEERFLLRISNLKRTLTETSLMTCHLDKKSLVLQIFIDGGTSF